MQTFFKSQMTSRPAEKRERAKVKLANLRKIHAAVDKRDKGCCRACGDRLLTGHRHRHHVMYRSRGGNDTLDNLVLLCARCHGEIHLKRLWIIGTDANGPLTFEPTGN